MLRRGAGRPINGLIRVCAVMCVGPQAPTAEAVG